MDAVPLFELYGNLIRYGPIIGNVPVMLSKYRINFMLFIYRFY